MGNNTNTTLEVFVDNLKEVTFNFSQTFSPTDPEKFNETVEAGIETFKSLTTEYIATGKSNNTLLINIEAAQTEFLLYVWNAIMDRYGFEPGESDIPASISKRSGTEEGPTANKAVAALGTAQLIVSPLFYACNLSQANLHLFIVHLLLHRHWVLPYSYGRPRHPQ